MDIINRFFTARKGNAWLFRVPVGWKFVVTTALLVVLVIDKSWGPQSVFALFSVMVYVSSGLTLELLTNLLLMIIPGTLIVLYHWLFGDVLTGVGLAGVFFSSLCLGRIMFLTTELPALMSAITVYLHPLSYIKIRPEVIALAMYLMIRSVPWLFVAAADIIKAHRARGIKLRIRTLFIPTIVAAVGYAKDTADALYARKLP